tara:strand:+ start:351 stop:470 length:120 start_codon:yes stop_codon:yes gene_type:complete
MSPPEDFRLNLASDLRSTEDPGGLVERIDEIDRQNDLLN